jgi:hypothetical protein
VKSKREHEKSTGGAREEPKGGRRGLREASCFLPQSSESCKGYLDTRGPKLTGNFIKFRKTKNPFKKRVPGSKVRAYMADTLD